MHVAERYKYVSFNLHWVTEIKFGLKQSVFQILIVWNFV